MHNLAGQSHKINSKVQWKRYGSYCMIIKGEMFYFFPRKSICNLYSFVVYLYVNGSGLITSVGEERANLSAVVYL